MAMLGFIKRQRELLSSQERVTRLLSMRRENPNGLVEQDFLQAARALNCRPAMLKAIHSVESSGSGFDSQGRLKILYEPHVVHRNTGGLLTGRTFEWREGLEIPLSYRSWKPLTNAIRHDDEAWHPYKENETGQWQMLASAYQYHVGALAGASYGGLQMLGENAVPIGFGSVLHMVKELYTGEAAHLEVAIRFLKMRGGLQAVRDRDFIRLTKAYRGAGVTGMKAHAARLERAYNRAEKVFA